MSLICPECGESFAGEEFCPVHYLRLVPAAAATPADPGPGKAAPADPSTPSGAPAGRARPEAPEAERESRLARFMSRKKLRPAGRPAGAAEAPPPADAGESTPLPDDVREKGWRIAGPHRPDGLADVWKVEHPTAGGGALIGRFRRFRAGALTPASLYRRLEEQPAPRLARIWSHGTVDLRGARADYELVSLPVAGTGLGIWLAESRPSEQRALHLLPLLAALLHELAGAGLVPLLLHPGQLTLADSCEMWLATAAALAETGGEPAFRPELERAFALAGSFTPPELGLQAMAGERAVLFSLGQILAAAVWGQPCSHEDVQSGAVPFRSLADLRLARVLMGCLWPRPGERWSLADLKRALAATGQDDLPAAPPWESLLPGASGTAFGFAGAAYWRPEDVLAAAVRPDHWAEAVQALDAILDWLAGTAWAGRAALLRAGLGEGRSRDWALVALNRAVRPDAPATWRDLDLSDGEAARSLAALAQRALQGGDIEAARLRELFAADLRGAFAGFDRVAPQTDSPSSEE